MQLFICLSKFHPSLAAGLKEASLANSLKWKLLVIADWIVILKF